MSAMKYSDNFAGHAPNNELGLNFIADCRKVLKGSGFGLTLYARNRDRKQFYQNDRSMTRGGFLRKHDYCQNLPMKFATTFALYVRVAAGTNYGDAGYKTKQDKAVGRIEAVRKIYEVHGLKA